MKLSYLAWLPWALAFKAHTDTPTNSSQSQDYGGHEINAEMAAVIQELAVALPLALINLTNASGLLHDIDAQSPDIAFHPGNISRDIEFVTDKAAGFYAALNDFMGPEDSVRYCPPGVPQNIWSCVHASVCIIQSAVPNHVGMDTYSGLLEQVTRFEEIGWPLLRDALLKEKGGNMLPDDFGMPEEYSCDSTVHDKGDFLLQSVSKSDALQVGTFAMSAALNSAMHSSHKVLDSHGVNSSMDDTIQKLHTVWHPVCKALGCDHTNYWDIFLRHHKHSLALLDTPHAVLLRSDIRKRFLLQHRVQKFISTHHRDITFVQKYARFGQEQASSEAVMRDHHERNKKALMEFVVPVVQAMPEERAVRLVDRQKLRDIEASGSKHKIDARTGREEADTEMDQETDEGTEEGTDEDEGTDGSLTHREKRDLDNDDDDMVDHAEADGDKEQLDARGHGTALSMLEEDESEGEGSGWGRRRRRRRRRRRSRRRRRWWKKIVKAVTKVVEVIVEALKCIGATSRFINTGYSKSLGTNVAWNMGLNAGTSEAMQDLIKGDIPSAWVSISTGFAVGSTTDWWWAGAGMSGSVGCSTASGCSLSINVAALACGLAEDPWSTACPLPDWFEDALGLKCGHSAGWSVSILCCKFDLSNGKNDCR